MATTPKTRKAFWTAKFDTNVNRDRRNQAALRMLGWKVFVVWECEVLRDPHGALRRVRKELGVPTAIRYRLPEKRELLRLAEKRLQWGLNGSRPASGT